MSTINSTSNSSTSYSSAYNANSRVTGLFSGLDTDALVKSMVSIQQAKIDKVMQNQTRQEWLDDSLKSVQETVNTFKSTYASVTGSSSMLKASTYYSYKVSSDSTSSAVTLSGSSATAVGSYSVKVNTLAQNAYVSSTGISGSAGEISANNTATLADLNFSNDLEFNSSGNISFSINGKAFTFSSDTTLQSMINTINNDSTANVTMKYSRLTDGFTITADNGGADSSVVIQNISGNAFGTGSAFGIAEGTVRNGNDADVEINGVSVTRDSNEFTIDDVTYSLNAVTKDTDNETISFTVARDYAATTSAIEEFVEAFNTMITKLTDLVDEEDYSTNYPPLTDAQKEEMTDAQISAWNSKAKSGILRHNTELERLISNLKETFFTSLGGTGQNMTSIGITTAGYFDDNAGQLVIDTDALEAALKENPEQVVSMFTNGNSSSTSSEQGLMYKLKNILSDYDDFLDASISTAETAMSDYNDTISDLEDKLDAQAERYYDKFSAMETALSKLNMQSSMLSQLFSSGT